MRRWCPTCKRSVEIDETSTEAVRDTRDAEILLSVERLACGHQRTTELSRANYPLDDTTGLPRL